MTTNTTAAVTAGISADPTDHGLPRTAVLRDAYRLTGGNIFLMFVTAATAYAIVVTP